jgi:hypothetical protein
MAANGIITGTGGNNFSPRATTPAEEAALYASATREQALAIAVRIADNLKDKPLDYTQGGQQATPTPSGNNSIVGKWGYGFNTSSWYDITTGDYAGASSYGEGWEFKSDGTYTHLLFGFGVNVAFSGVYRENGKYRIEGNKLHLTSILGRFDPVGGKTADAYVDEVFPDEIITFVLNSDGTLSITNRLDITNTYEKTE